MKCNSLWFALVLVFLLETVSGDYAELPSDVNDIVKEVTAGRELIYRVNINSLVDKYISFSEKFSPFVLPTPLDDITHKLTSHIYVNLKQGYLRNLTNTKRTGECTLMYRKRVLTVDLTLGWDETKFDYDYLIQLLLYKRTGGLLGNIHDLKMNIAIEFDLKTYETRLKKLDFIDSGKISLKLEGKLLDWIYNQVIKGITTVARKAVLKNMEAECTKLIQNRIDELNAILGKSGEPKFKFVNMLEKNRY